MTLTGTLVVLALIVGVCAGLWLASWATEDADRIQREYEDLGEEEET